MASEKRLIDANALENRIRTNAKVEVNDTKYDVGRVHGLINAADLIHNAPTVDAVEVVHGRWLDNGMCNHKPHRFRNPDKWTIYKCSECSYSNGRKFNANYCPNCGAKMDGDGNG